MTLPEQTTTVQIPNETPQSIPQRVEAPVRLRTRDPYELAKTGTPEELKAAVNAGVVFNVKISEFDENSLNFNINYEFGNDETPLHRAAYYNRNPESIRFLIEQGLDVNAGFYSGNAFWGDVLSLAVISRNINAIYELLRHGADQNSWSNIWSNITTGDDDGDTYSGSPLHIIAAWYKDDYSVTKSLIEAIINAGGNVNYHEAIDADDKEFLKDTSLLPRSEWTSQNPIDNIEYYSNMGLRMFRPSFTPLMFAVLYDNPDAVDILLDCKADANIRSGEGKNALDYANELPANSAIKRSDVFNRLRAATRK
jgi:ankyrin repeat protein